MDDFELDLKRLADSRARDEYLENLKSDEAAELEASVSKWIMYWREILRLGYWDIYSEVIHDDPDLFDGGYAYADSLHWPYQTVSLHFNGDLMRAFPDEKVGRVVLHELLHALISGVEHCEERVVTDLEWIIGGLDDRASRRETT